MCEGEIKKLKDQLMSYTRPGDIESYIQHLKNTLPPEDFEHFEEEVLKPLFL